MSDPDVPQFDFAPPPPLSTQRFHLEVLSPVHNERDYEAWTSSMDHIKTTPGMENWGWPIPMTLAENLADMEMHAREYEERTGYTYSILDGPASDDSEVIGCIYIYPPKEPADGDARVRSWVRATRAAEDSAVRDELRAWLLSDAWPFESVTYAG